MDLGEPNCMGVVLLPMIEDHPPDPVSGMAAYSVRHGVREIGLVAAFQVNEILDHWCDPPRTG